MNDLSLERHGSVGVVVLDRPQRLNALTPSMEAALHALLDELATDPGIGCVVLTGRGRAFCAGEDIAGDETGHRAAAPGDGEDVADYLARWQAADADTIAKLTHLWQLRIPVVAAVNGHALGKGFWYQLACDVSVAGSSAVFGEPEVRHTSSTSYLFTALAGWHNANRYALTGDVFGADEALRMGVVSEVVPDEELRTRAVDLARRIAAVPAPAVRLAKATAMLGLQASGLSAAMQLNGVLAALAHASHSRARESLFRIQAKHGLGAFLRARDGPFETRTQQEYPHVAGED